MRKPIRVAVLPDIHTPKHQENCVKSVLQCLKYEKPDILIHLGDLCDFDSISRFDVAHEADLISFADEVAAGNDMLDRIEGVLPKRCRKVLIKGNHDHRPELYRLNRWDKNIQSVLGFSRMENMEVLCALDSRGWETTDFGGTFQLGKCLFRHGTFINRYHAAKNVSRWFETIIYGHTHTWQVFCLAGRDGHPVAGMSVGTLSRFDLSYLKGEPPDGWVHMFMMMDFFEDGTFTPHMLPLVDGRFAYNGQVYEDYKQITRRKA